MLTHPIAHLYFGISFEKCFGNNVPYLSVYFFPGPKRQLTETSHKNKSLYLFIIFSEFVMCNFAVNLLLTSLKHYLRLRGFLKRNI